MEDHVRQARSILAVYLERGEAALALLGACRDDDAAELLRLRTAAYHNFRAADARAGAAGHDLTKDVGIRALVGRLPALDKALHTALAEAKVRTAELQQRLREARRALGSYRSGPADAGPTFTHPA